MQEIAPDTYEQRLAKTSGRIKDGRDGAPRTFEGVYGAGTIDHIAFACQDLEGFKGRLRDLEVPFGEAGVASAAVRQLFLRDPNGIVVELNFRD
jgi:hypothetical protein